MKHLKIDVIVPQGQEYKLSSVFMDSHIESLHRNGIDAEVMRLVDTDSANTKSIVLDARLKSENHMCIPESVYSYLDETELGILAQTLCHQMWKLEYSGKIFLNDIRSLCEYMICHYCEYRSDNFFFRFMYATAGAFQNVDKKSKKYLNDIIESVGDKNYRDDYYFTNILGTAYYLLARDETDDFKKHGLMMKSLAYHELYSLNNRKFPNPYNVMEYALTMIEIGRMLYENPSYNHIFGQNASFEKAIYIMEHQLIDVLWPNIQKMEPDIKQCQLELLEHEIGIVEKRLSQVAPLEYHGKIQSYLESLKPKI